MGSETLATQLREIAVELAPQAQASELRPGAFVFEDPDVNKVAVDALNAAADRLSLLSPELGGWRGIESAPRNAKEILVLCRRNGVLAVVVAHWADGGGEEQPRFRGWFYSTDHGFVGMRSEPTHWMPLPPPPTGAR